jgi:hypothetical protein
MAVTRCESNSALLLTRLRVAHKPYARRIVARGMNIAQWADVTAKVRVSAMFLVANTPQSL